MGIFMFGIQLQRSGITFLCVSLECDDMPDGMGDFYSLVCERWLFAMDELCNKLWSGYAEDTDRFKRSRCRPKRASLDIRAEGTYVTVTSDTPTVSHTERHTWTKNCGKYLLIRRETLNHSEY